MVLSDVPLEQKPFDRCTGNTKGSLWQRGSAFAFFEVAADLASVIIWPTMPGKLVHVADHRLEGHSWIARLLGGLG